MADNRYNKWQGLAIAQLSVAVALISGLSVAGLGVGITLLQNKDFQPIAPFRLAFGGSLLLLLFAAFSSCGAVITRMLDFRLTARKVRKDQKPDYNRPLIIFGLGPDAYGCATWGLFWFSFISFTVGVISLVVSIGATYATRLY
jgi:hypothetical protein